MNRQEYQSRLPGALRAGRWRAALALGLLSTLLTGCASGPQSALDPSGPGAESVSRVWWLMFGLGTGIYILVLIALAVAVVRARREGSAEDRLVHGDGMRLVVAGGVVLPVIVLPVVLVATLMSMADLSPSDDEPDVVIEVIGHQWWWEVHYVNEGFTTANEIHIPAGQPIELRLATADVIHSFWVPRLAGKIDMIPGKVNTTWIEADEPGEFRGQCAEFCGIQHTLMAFHVIAQSDDDYQAWVAGQQQIRQWADSDDEAVATGLQLYVAQGCGECHTIEGIGPQADIGPDLTHFASREWIAAGTLPNNFGNVSLWMVDPQTVKPGNLMPSFSDLEASDLQALVTFLMSLE